MREELILFEAWRESSDGRRIVLNLNFFVLTYQGFAAYPGDYSAAFERLERLSGKDGTCHFPSLHFLSRIFLMDLTGEAPEVIPQKPLNTCFCFEINLFMYSTATQCSRESDLIKRLRRLQNEILRGKGNLQSVRRYLKIL